MPHYTLLQVDLHANQEGTAANSLNSDLMIIQAKGQDKFSKPRESSPPEDL